jgi:hypothetical protein
MVGKHRTQNARDDIDRRIPGRVSFRREPGHDPALAAD